ncbi:3-phosphoglycerate kinase [Pseudomonas citronellolis]|uniref:3-phosphoglycerate kinase n=1 Tax=Pseudomonas citronellolis TaxID=53408 RepID=UPI0023E3FB33|nr:3-phosphoglycerate kinase [Pseudomonas citronellolis]MDF3931791.1 3-phosphoglycerate kinase [Pseudomonas citronellolis]
MKRICCALLLCLPLTAMAYPTEMEKSLNGTEIDVQTQDIGDSMGAVLLQNYGKQDVACTAVFQNGPETPKVRKTVIAAGKSSNLTASFGRAIIKLRIKLTCNPN